MFEHLVNKFNLTLIIFHLNSKIKSNLDNRKNVKIKDLPLVKVREFGRSYIK